MPYCKGSYDLDKTTLRSDILIGFGLRTRRECLDVNGIKNALCLIETPELLVISSKPTEVNPTSLTVVLGKTQPIEQQKADLQQNIAAFEKALGYLYQIEKVLSPEAANE